MLVLRGRASPLEGREPLAWRFATSSIAEALIQGREEGLRRLRVQRRCRTTPRLPHSFAGHSRNARVDLRARREIWYTSLGARGFCASIQSDGAPTGRNSQRPTRNEEIVPCLRPRSVRDDTYRGPFPESSWHQSNHSLEKAPVGCARVTGSTSSA